MNSNPHPLALGKASAEQPADRRTLAHECRHPACATITLREFCAKHRPLGRAQPNLEELRAC